MWANKLRDIKGVIWELFSKPNMLRWVGLSHQPSLGRFHMTMLLTKGLQWDLPTFKMNMALLCFVTFQAKGDQKPGLIFWNLRVKAFRYDWALAIISLIIKNHNYDKVLHHLLILSGFIHIFSLVLFFSFHLCLGFTIPKPLIHFVSFITL